MLDAANTVTFDAALAGATKSGITTAITTKIFFISRVYKAIL